MAMSHDFDVFPSDLADIQADMMFLFHIDDFVRRRALRSVTHACAAPPAQGRFAIQFFIEARQAIRGGCVEVSLVIESPETVCVTYSLMCREVTMHDEVECGPCCDPHASAKLSFAPRGDFSIAVKIDHIARSSTDAAGGDSS
jgi:hypothetical protein